MQVEVTTKDTSCSASSASPVGKTRANGSPVIKISAEAEVQVRESEIAAAIDRSNMYTSLGALLAAPATEEHCAVLRALPEIESPETSMEIAWTLLRKSASLHSADQINDEYHTLFIGLGRGEVVPYGSWHMTGFLMEKPLGQLRADLNLLGFERNENVAESEDHIASLCQAMAAIILADEINFDTERKFFNDHIAPWSEDFFKLVQNATSADFYRAVGLLGESFIGVEKQYLSMAI